MREDRKGFILQNNIKFIAFDSNSSFTCAHVNMSGTLKFTINSEILKSYNESVGAIKLFSFLIITLQHNL